MIRWLVSDVPLRLNVHAEPAPEDGIHAWRLSATVRGPEFEAREDAVVTFNVTRQNGTELQLTGRPADDEVGRYVALVSADESGPWHCSVTAKLDCRDQKIEELTAQHGWASQPEQQEMAAVEDNRLWMQTVAEKTGGRVLSADELDSFVDDLQTSDAPVMETFSWPIWHQWGVFLVALACFAGDWTIRRRRGYP